MITDEAVSESEENDKREPFPPSYPDKQQSGGDQRQTALSNSGDKEQESEVDQLDADEKITDTLTVKERESGACQLPLEPSCHASADVTVTRTRTIVILGKVGMGKATIANKIAGTTVFPVLSPVESMVREPGQREKGCFQPSVPTTKLYRDSKLINLRFMLFDTRSSDKNQTLFRRECEENLADKGVNLIMFVLNEKTLTHEDTDLMDDVVKHLQKEKVAGSSVLVLTGCEQLGKEARQEYHKKLHESKLTKNIANFVSQELLVGFPDEMTTSPLFMQQYQEAVEEDTQNLRDLVLKSCSSSAIAVQDMFKKKTAWSQTSNWFFGLFH
jgi:hypothetical protein